MDKTIRVGEIYTEIKDGDIYILTERTCVGWIPLNEKTTKEIIESGGNPSIFSEYMIKAINAREAISLYKSARELGMSEHEDVTYWLRDYIVEKMRETQTVS